MNAIRFWYASFKAYFKATLLWKIVKRVKFVVLLPFNEMISTDVKYVIWDIQTIEQLIIKYPTDSKLSTITRL